MQLLPQGWQLSIFIYSYENHPAFLRRRVVFLSSKTFFRKTYAAASYTIPFKISRMISRNVSMIITSFPKTERSATTDHPHNIQSRFHSTVFPSNYSSENIKKKSPTEIINLHRAFQRMGQGTCPNVPFCPQ
jgi:hypothetical protein